MMVTVLVVVGLRIGMEKDDANSSHSLVVVVVVVVVVPAVGVPVVGVAIASRRHDTGTIVPNETSVPRREPLQATSWALVEQCLRRTAAAVVVVVVLMWHEPEKEDCWLFVSCSKQGPSWEKATATKMTTTSSWWWVWWLLLWHKDWSWWQPQETTNRHTTWMAMKEKKQKTHVPCSFCP